jgi:hypothetical protein
VGVEELVSDQDELDRSTSGVRRFGQREILTVECSPPADQPNTGCRRRRTGAISQVKTRRPRGRSRRGPNDAAAATRSRSRPRRRRQDRGPFHRASRGRELDRRHAQHDAERLNASANRSAPLRADDECSDGHHRRERRHPQRRGKGVGMPPRPRRTERKIPARRTPSRSSMRQPARVLRLGTDRPPLRYRKLGPITARALTLRNAHDR